MLIDAYTDHKHKFNSVFYKSKHVWEIITAAIQKALISKCNFIVPNLTQTENKWKQLKFSYKKHVDMLEKSGDVGEAQLF